MENSARPRWASMNVAIELLIESSEINNTDTEKEIQRNKMPVLSLNLE